ncbi:MAG: carboxynorspermidine decarboxylase, partial [Candidatus Dadabacteria bacterium]
MSDAIITLRPWMAQLDVSAVPCSPCWVIDQDEIAANARQLADVQARSGARVLAAFKGFANPQSLRIVRDHLAGAAVSSLHEAQLAAEIGFAEIHAYAPAWSAADLDAVAELADHIVMNSSGQLQRLGGRARRRGASMGLRINPEHREVEVPLYDPCAPGSRLGAVREHVDETVIAAIDGIHIHNLCELGADAAARTVAAVEARFADVLERVDWVNLGGGHHVTRPEYDREALVSLLRAVADRWNVQVYIEPGEAVAIGCGVLIATVLELSKNRDVTNVILDVSATAHMPDTLEMPYRPHIIGAGLPGEHPHT